MTHLTMRVILILDPVSSWSCLLAVVVTVVPIGTDLLLILPSYRSSNWSSCRGRRSRLRNSTSLLSILLPLLPKVLPL